jgi:hypothetical protein
MCIVVTLFPWQMASNKTTPTASGIRAGFPLRAEGEAGGEGSETHLPAPPELPLDLAQVLANQTRLIEVLTRSLEKPAPRWWKATGQDGRISETQASHVRGVQQSSRCR